MSALNSYLDSAAFYSGAGITSAHDADDRILYNTTTGALYYDSDGNGSMGASQVATLQNLADLSSGDIWIIR